MMEGSKPCGEKCSGRRNSECKGPEVETGVFEEEQRGQCGWRSMGVQCGEWRTGRSERLAGKTIHEVSSAGQGL